MPKDKTAEYYLANLSKQPSLVNTTILQGDKVDIVPAFELDQLQRRVILLEDSGILIGYILALKLLKH
jgi:hypothetical protein